MANMNLASPRAYTGQKATKYHQGAIRLASATEIAAGTATGVAITPSQFSAGLRVREGANAKQGVVTLVAGTAVVLNTSVTATSRIQLTAQSLGTVTVPSALAVSARTAGTSFTILASQGTDTSVIAYEIFEPAA